MTRQKIDPKTVATVQNALPKIVFALIFVTFSYPIAGLMIDLMYVLLGLVITIINAGFPGGEANVNKILSDGLFQYVIGGGLIVSAGSISQMVAGITNNLLGLQDVPIASNIAGGISGGLAFVIVAIAILVALFRTWLTLIGAFANIILQIIFAPLRLTLDAIPGQNQFGAWLKDLLANLLAFPLVAIFLAIGSGIAAQGPGMDPNLKGFVPPLIGAGNVREILPFVGLGILLSIPKAIDILREVIKAPAFKYGSAWSEALGTATGVARGAASEYGPAKTYQLAKAGYEKQRGEQLANDTGWVARAARGFQAPVPNPPAPRR